MDYRPLRESDLEALYELHQRSQTHDRYPFTASRDELRETWDSSAFDPEVHSRVAFDGGRMVAFAEVWHKPSSERLERAYLWGHIDPDYRGKGLGRELLAWQVESSQQFLSRATHDLPRVIHVDTYDWCEDRIALFKGAGFAPVRYFEELIRPLTELPEPADIDDIVVAPYDNQRDEEARQVKNESFKDHWGSTATDAVHWKEWMDSHSTRQDLSFVALADDRVVGVSVNSHYPEDEATSGRRDGWIDALGVLRHARGRGVASALISASLQAFSDAGFTHAALGVDSANPTGAAELYKRLGFDTHTKSTTYQIEL